MGLLIWIFGVETISSCRAFCNVAVFVGPYVGFHVGLGGGQHITRSGKHWGT